MSSFTNLDSVMLLTLEERGALYTLEQLAETRDNFVPDQERWLAGWLQCSVRKWRVIRAALIVKGRLRLGEQGSEQGFLFGSASNQLRVSVEPTSNRKDKFAETETKVNEINESDAASCERVRVGDNNLPQRLLAVGGGVGEREVVSETDDWPEGDLVQVLTRAAESPWLDPQKSIGLVTSAGRLAAWKRRGASWTRHVLPVVAALAKSHGEPIRTWQFFEPAIARAVKSSRDDLTLPEGVIRLPTATGPPDVFAKMAAERAEARRRALEEPDTRHG